jgi:hypothetical protein
MARSDGIAYYMDIFVLKQVPTFFPRLNSSIYFPASGNSPMTCFHRQKRFRCGSITIREGGIHQVN